MPNNSSEILPKKEYHGVILDIAHGLYLYLSPMLLVVGLTGSVLTFSIMYKRAKSNATYLYLTILSVADVFALYIPCIKGFIYYASNRQVDLTKIFKCGWFNLFYYSCTNISVYIVICVAIDRFISVYFPYAAKLLSTPRRAIIVCISIGISQFIINLHYLWTYRLLVVGNEIQCAYPDKYTNWMNYIWTWIDLSIYSFIPVTTLTNLSSLIIYKLLKRRKQLAASQSASTTTNKRSMTVTLIVICFVMLLCNTPIVVINLLTPKLDLSTPERQAAYQLAMAIAEHLMYLNNSINFFLYIITTKRFRQELMIKLRLEKFLSATAAGIETANNVNSITAASTGIRKTVTVTL